MDVKRMILSTLLHLPPVGPKGKMLAQAPYGADAESLITVTLQAKTRNIKGTDYAQYLKEKGYEGP